MKFGIREFVFVALLLGLLGGAYFLVFTKTDKKRIEMRQDIEAKRKALSDVEASTAGIDDLGRKIDELQQAIQFFESKLPREKEIDTILTEVSNLADANSLQTKTVKTLKSERAANYREQPIQMSLSGDFNGFYSFLLQLEKLPRLTRVTQMNLQKINGREGQMQAQMTLSIFFEPESATASVN